MRFSDRLVLTTISVTALAFAAGAYFRVGATPALASNGEYAAGGPLATCDVYKASDLLMKSDRFAPVIMNEQRATEQRMKGLGTIESELLEMQNRLSQYPADTKDPNAKTLAEQFQKKREDYLGQRQQMNDAFEAFVAAKNYEAYNLVVDAARVVSARRGYTHIFATRLVDDAKAPETGLGFTMRLLARPVVLGPQADDITNEVLNELKLDPNKKPDAPAPAAPVQGR